MNDIVRLRTRWSRQIPPISRASQTDQLRKSTTGGVGATDSDAGHRHFKQQVILGIRGSFLRLLTK
jgi:hypothetical protein